MTLNASALFRHRDFLRFFLGPAIFAMLALIIVQEICGAATTWLVIQIGRDIADANVTAHSFIWIVVSQALSYLAGAISWIYAERAGFTAYGRYMAHFARQNRHATGLLGNSQVREQAEPFLTSETFHICFDLMYDLEFHLRLFFHLVFNAAVLGAEIDAGLPLAYGVAFTLLVAMQWLVRKPVSRTYLHNQRMTNRMTARTYTAWDNIFAGNRYNLGLWQRDFRQRLQLALSAQIRAILAKEGLSAVSGIVAVILVLSMTAWVAVHDVGNTALLIGLAATLPRQIEMTVDMYQLTAGFNDFVALWTRIGGVCEHIQPQAEDDFRERIRFERLVLKEGTGSATREIVCDSLAAAVHAIQAQPTGVVAVRGGNGAGKSTLLAALKAQLQGAAYYWPTQDRLAFVFNTEGAKTPFLTDKQDALTDAADADFDEEAEEAEALSAAEAEVEKKGYSSGERQLQVLREVVMNTDHAVYLLDEWDANLDASHRITAQALLAQLAARARVVEISHREPSALGDAASNVVA